MTPSKADIDPRLQAQIAEAGDNGQVEALIVLEGPAGAGSEDAKLGHQLVDRVSRQVREQPAEVRLMPRLGVLFVKGSAKLVRALLHQKEVAAASANEGDITIPER
jgi:hypothetical protein